MQGWEKNTVEANIHSCLSNELHRFVHLLRFPDSRCPLQEFFWGTADSHRCLSASCNVETEVFENKTTLQWNIDIILMKGKLVESTCLIICFAWLRLLNSNIVQTYFRPIFFRHAFDDSHILSIIVMSATLGSSGRESATFHYASTI